jgi:hypothetical protein
MELVGRPNHVCFIIPQARHFVAPAGYSLLKSRRGRAQPDPKCWPTSGSWSSLQMARHKGISFQLLVSFRVPTHVFSIRRCRAWHGILRSQWQGMAMSFRGTAESAAAKESLLTYLSSSGPGRSGLRSPLVGCRLGPVSRPKRQHVRRWLRKSNFSEHNHTQLEASRHLAHPSCEVVPLSTQWFPGKAKAQ